jgi:hypothetical protein
MRKIPLTQGKFALVDDEDFEYLSQFKWCARKDWYTFYASRTIYPNGYGKHKQKITVQMHREVMGLQRGDGKSVDHKNRNGLDNRKKNLRLGIGSINQVNCRKRKDNTSGYRGVSWNIVHKKWFTRISIKGKRFSFGGFSTPIEAAIAYDKAVMKYRDASAPLNFPTNRRVD